MYLAGDYIIILHRYSLQILFFPIAHLIWAGIFFFKCTLAQDCNFIQRLQWYKKCQRTFSLVLHCHQNGTMELQLYLYCFGAFINLNFNKYQFQASLIKKSIISYLLASFYKPSFCLTISAILTLSMIQSLMYWHRIEL